MVHSGAETPLLVAAHRGDAATVGRLIDEAGTDAQMMRCHLRKSRSLIGATVLFSAVVLGLPPAESLAFQGRGQGPKAEKAKKAEKKRDDKRDDRQDAVAVDRDRYVRVIREHERGGSLPPGLAKRDSLPPGLRRQLRARGTRVSRSS